MNANPDNVAERSRLQRLINLADRIAADEWRLERSNRGERWIVSSRFDGSEHVICDLTRYARNDEVTLLSEALDQLTFFLPLFDRAAKRTRHLASEVARLEQELAALKGAAPTENERNEQSPGRQKDYAAQASMLLVDPVFQRFLSEIRDGEVVDDKEAADVALKTELGITSKKQLNTDAAAAALWLDFHAKYQGWMRL